VLHADALSAAFCFKKSHDAAAATRCCKVQLHCQQQCVTVCDVTRHGGVLLSREHSLILLAAPVMNMWVVCVPRIRSSVCC
jgi:hypothetical protein